MTDRTKFHRESKPGGRVFLAAIAAAAIFALSLMIPVATGPGGGITANSAHAGTGVGGDASQVQAPEGQITIAVFTTRIKKRYPADEITNHANPHRPVSFFSELKAFAGREITHRWFHEGRLMFEASFRVRADLWRVWSTQLLPEDLPGRWTVEIVDEGGKVLATHRLDYAPKGTDIAAN